MSVHKVYSSTICLASFRDIGLYLYSYVCSVMTVPTGIDIGKMYIGMSLFDGYPTEMLVRRRYIVANVRQWK